MEVSLLTKPNGYGFGRDWILLVEFDDGSKKTFWMGQNVKVIRRILGMDEETFRSLLREYLHDEDMEFESAEDAMASIIVNQLELSENDFREMKSWSLAVH